MTTPHSMWTRSLRVRRARDKFIPSSPLAPDPINFPSPFTYRASLLSVSLPTFCPHFPPLFYFLRHLESFTRSGVVDAAVVPHLWSVFIRNGPYYLDSIHAEFMLSRWWRLSCGHRGFRRNLLVEHYVITPFSVGRCSVTTVKQPLVWKQGFDHFSSLHWQKAKENVLNTEPVRVWQEM